MEKYILWIVTVVAISCVLVFLLVWIIRLKIAKNKRQLDEEIILLPQKENAKINYNGYDDINNSEKRIVSSKEQDYMEKSNYLSEFCIGHYDSHQSEKETDSFVWVNRQYRIFLKFHVHQELSWSVEIVKVVFLLLDNSEIENVCKYFVTMVIVGHNFDTTKKLKTEPSKLVQHEIMFGNKISQLDSMEDVVLELQLLSVDKYARHRVRSEIVIQIDRIVKIHPSLELENLLIDVGNIEKEADVMNKNEITSKNLLLSFTSIYSFNSSMFSISVDQALPNMIAVSRRYSEIKLQLSLLCGGVIQANQEVCCVEQTSPNTFTTEKAAIFPLDKKISKPLRY